MTTWVGALVRGSKLVGVLSTDDLLVRLASDLANLARPVTAEIMFRHNNAPLPAPR